jgi:hypothetical protein
MGMRDESWCAGCGVGIHFTEDENAMCHNCNEEGYVELETKSSKFMEYMKIHLISLNQDLEDARNNIPLNEDEYFESDSFYMGAIDATEHLLSVANDIMISSNERYK